MTIRTLIKFLQKLDCKYRIWKLRVTREELLYFKKYENKSPYLDLIETVEMLRTPGPNPCLSLINKDTK